MKEILSIMALSAEELYFLGEFMRIAKEAVEYAEKVRKLKVSFPIGQKEVEIYHEDSFDEYYGHGYISVNGHYTYWDNWWGGREWELYLNEEEIYKVFRAEFLLEKGRKDLLLPAEYDIDQFSPHLRRFLETIEIEEE